MHPLITAALQIRELKAQVAKLAQAVKNSIPVIAETIETIRNHMILTQYHLHHNEMQKEVIHDWMNHFNPILNKYNMKGFPLLTLPELLVPHPVPAPASQD